MISTERRGGLEVATGDISRNNLLFNEGIDPLLAALHTAQENAQTAFLAVKRYCEETPGEDPKFAVFLGQYLDSPGAEKWPALQKELVSKMRIANVAERTAEALVDAYIRRCRNPWTDNSRASQLRRWLEANGK